MGGGKNQFQEKMQKKESCCGSTRMADSGGSPIYLNDEHRKFEGAPKINSEMPSINDDHFLSLSDEKHNFM